MELKEMVCKFLKNEWSEQEMKEIRTKRMTVLEELMGSVGYLDKDINLILDDPECDRARRLKAHYREAGDWKLDFIDELAPLEYIKSQVSDSSIDYSKGSELKLEIGLKQGTLTLKLDREYDDKTKPERRIVLDLKDGAPVMDDMLDNFDGEVRVQFPRLKNIISFKGFIKKEFLEEASKNIEEKASYRLEVYFDREGHGGYVALWYDGYEDLARGGRMEDGAVYVNASKYSQNLDKFLSMLSL